VRPWLVALGGVSLCSLFSAPAHAYCLTHTCDPMHDNCEMVDGCNVSGKVLFWPSSCVSYDVQKDGSQKLGISYDTISMVAVNAFSQWLNADCGGGTHPSIRLADLGPVACSLPEYNKSQPNANIITFRDNDWPYANAVDTLALTTVWFNSDSGEIFDANMEINSFMYDFAVGEQGTKLDLASVVTHEAGHFLGLSHSSSFTATMYRSYNSQMSTIEMDDVLAICESLPPTRVPDSDDCTPRHGFSGACSTTQTGCCSTAVGAAATRGQPLALVALGLGLSAWRVRRRTGRSKSLDRV